MQLTEQQITDIHIRINKIKNIATILDILHKPLQKLKEEKNFQTIEQTITEKEKADKFIKQYVSFTIKNNLEEIKNILQGIQIKQIVNI